jgi:hypothetical protein
LIIKRFITFMSQWTHIQNNLIIKYIILLSILLCYSKLPKACGSLHVIKDITTHVSTEDTYIITKQPPRYSWNIVESVVKHQNTTHKRKMITTVFSLRSETSKSFTCQRNYVHLCPLTLGYSNQWIWLDASPYKVTNQKCTYMYVYI